VVIAHGVHETGWREIIGLDVGQAQTETFWIDFVGSLVARGLVGVQLASATPTKDSRTRSPRCSARRGSAARCTPARLPRARAPRSARPAGGAVRPIFNAENLAAARDKLSEALATLQGTLPKVAGVLETAEEDILASTRFRPTTGASSAAPTHRSASTARSAGAPTSSGSSPTTAA